MKRIVLLASGAGSNAANIIRYFHNRNTAEIVLVATNRAGAGVLDVAAANKVPTYLLTKENFQQSNEFILHVQALQVDVVVLAGFLWKVPALMVTEFPHRIVNIHPSLLPKYGGKGMYGHHVHEAVHQAGESESGITIHWVNEQYDEGGIIAQHRVKVEPSDTPLDIERKVRALEMEWFPRVVEDVLMTC